MFVVRWVLELLDNNQPVLRFIRVSVMAGLATVVTVMLQQLPGIDWPGNYDPIIVMLGTGILAAADKWLRSHNAVSG